MLLSVGREGHDCGGWKGKNFKAATFAVSDLYEDLRPEVFDHGADLSRRPAARSHPQLDYIKKLDSRSGHFRGQRCRVDKPRYRPREFRAEVADLAGQSSAC